MISQGKNAEDYRKILKENWGYDDFRPLQLDIIESVGAGNDTVAILPTGGGKSITYQVPALASDGLTIVISPLIALMTDQVKNLKKRGIKAAVLHSGLTRSRIVEIINQAEYGAYKLLYVSPERLTSSLFVNHLSYLNITLIAVDEAHCISEWGYDFRPAYLKIAELRNYFPDTPVLALTASSTPDVTNDIQDKLRMDNATIFQAGVERDNLAYVVRECTDKENELYKILCSVAGTGIVYTRTRERAEQLAVMLQSTGISADYYHAGMDSDERTARQQEWMDGKIRILCSTNAFGMGIDKPDVRIVVHFDIPDALEAYYQEAGRAGRDGKRAYAVLLTTPSATEAVLKRHERLFPSKEFVRMVYQYLADYYVVGVDSGEGAVFPFNLEEFCSVFHISYAAASGALNILQWADYITITEEMENASKLKIIMPPRELYDWRQHHPTNDLILETFMRMYTGLFTEPQHISEQYIADYLHIDSQTVYSYLLYLRRVGVVRYIPFKRTPLLIYNTDRLDADTLFIPKKAYENRIDHMKSRLMSMYRYITDTDTCRTVTLAKYFGQTDTKPCNHCDICIAKRKK